MSSTEPLHHSESVGGSTPSAQALPSEIVCLICDVLLGRSHHRTLASLLQSSRGTYNLVAPYLYRNLILTGANAPRVFSGLATPPARLLRGRRSRRPPSAPPWINWRIFNSRDFYLEWAGLFEAAPNEGLRSRREYLVWPAADADSGEEEEGKCERDKEDVQTEGRTSVHETPTATEGSLRDAAGLQWPHPTFASHKRKQALLKLVERLHITEIPSRDLCEELDNLIRAGGTIFERVKHLSLSAKAFWTLVDWEDRHRSRSHPFRSVLKGLHPAHLCIHYPTIDITLEKRYMMPRIVTNEEHLSRQSTMDQYTFLRRELDELLCSKYQTLALRGMAEGWTELESVTVHNVSGEGVPTSVGANVKRRIFLHPCPCRDGSIAESERITETACYSHWGPLYRGRWMARTFRQEPHLAAHATTRPATSSNASQESLDPAEVADQGPNRFGQWELIDVDWTEGDAWPLSRSVRLDALESERMWQQVEQVLGEYETQQAMRRVYTINCGEAEFCVCCGEKQLKYSEATLA